MTAVAVADGVGFGGQVEGAGPGGRGHQVHRFSAVRFEVLGGGGRDEAVVLFELAEQGAAVGHAWFGNPVDEAQVTDAKVLLGRVGVEDERVVAIAEAAAVLAGGEVEEAVAVGAGGDDVGREGKLVSVALREPAEQGAEAGVVGRAGIDERAVDAVGAADGRPVHARVVGALLVMDGADDGEAIGQGGEAGDQLADLQAGDGGGDRGE